MADKTYALVDSSDKAINFIVWDGVTEFDYGQSKGNYLVPIEEGMRYGYNWTWDGTNFIDPNAVV